MNPINRTPPHLIETDVDCHFQRAYSGDRILNIYLEVRKNWECWQVYAKTTLEFGALNSRKYKEITQEFTLENGQFRWLGAWQWPFLKGACLNMAGKVEMLDEIIESRPDNITPEELGGLGDRTLFDISGYSNGFAINSSCLNEISEQLVSRETSKIVTQDDISKTANIKIDEEEQKENHNEREEGLTGS